MILKYSIKLVNNVKFDFLAYFNMEIMLNDSDRLFEISNIENINVK